jgi:hypothetical protein
MSHPTTSGRVTAEAVTAGAPVELPTIPLRDLLPWAFLVGFVSLVLLYFVGSEQGALSVFPGTFMHEFVHDSRHLLGFPCH